MQKKVIHYSTQCIEKDDINAVVRSLKGDYLTQGPTIKEFEDKVAHYCGNKYAVAMNSGTSALHAACYAADIGKGNEVITSPITFVASANCVLYCGGTPVFADIDPDTALISPIEIEKKTTKRTKAIIPVDFAGQPCDMDEINKIAKKHGLIVIEDAAHSLGAKYKRRNIGSFADMTIISFHAVKHITTGEGGMVLTNNKSFYEKLLMFRSHGITRNVKGPGPWYYEMQELGYNYRITDFQCALGISQLKKLDRFVSIRRKLAKQYNMLLSKIYGIDIPIEKPGRSSSYHLYPIRLKKDLIHHKRSIYEKLHSKGIGVNVHYIPVHLQPYYRKTLGHNKGDFPNAETFYERALSLPLHQKMTISDIKTICSELQSIINNIYNAK